jgi:hypothetical protein
MAPPARTDAVDGGCRHQDQPFRGTLQTPEDVLDARVTFARRGDEGEMHGLLSFKCKSKDGSLRDND